MKHVWLGVAVLVVGACGSPREDGTPGAAKGAPPQAPSAQTSASGGAIAGSVTFAGAVPANPPVDMSEEPTCKAKYPGGARDPIVSVTAGGLGNVFVYVKSGLPAAGKYAVSTDAVELDQLGCLYQPRVVGVMVNQPLRIKNGDQVLHNIKAVPKANRGFNISQPQQGMETTRTFTVEEMAVPLECNVHGWMHGKVFVMGHPFFAVTNENGEFAIKGLPAGTYVLEAWHEKLGTRSATVTVTEGGSAAAAFTFGG